MKLTTLLLASSLVAFVVALSGSLPAFAATVTGLILASFCRDYVTPHRADYFAEVHAPQRSALRLAA